MTYLVFAASAVLVAVAGVLAARYGDVIAVRTQLGRFLFGTLLLAAGTSLPELASAFNAIASGVPDLAAGNLLGSILVNMLALALVDLFSRQRLLLHRLAINHALTAALAVLMIATALFFILLPPGGLLGRLHVDSLLLVLLFLAGIRLVQFQARRVPMVGPLPAPGRQPTLRGAIVGFALAVVLLLLATPVLVNSARGVAELTGLGVGFIGVALFPLITATPEFASSIAAVRIGAFDLAVGNLFGSCVFNIFALAAAGFLQPGESLFAAISPGFEVVGILGLVLISIALLGTLAPAESRVLGIEWDALLIIVTYLAGVYLLFRQGLLQAARG